MGFSEAQLVRRLKANDHAAFEEVVERHYQSAYRQLWLLCGEAETAAVEAQQQRQRVCAAGRVGGHAV